MARQSLGRGFDVLIPKDFDKEIIEEDKHRVQKLLITDVFPNDDQPRRGMDEVALQEMTESVRRHGVLQPIIVVKNGDVYRIVAGERRWRAAKAADLSHIPAIVRSFKELEELEVSLIENIQRADLSPLEQALAIYRLQQQFGLALEQIAQKLGKAISTISNTTRLLNLPDAARTALVEKRITEGHARAILALAGHESAQAELLQSIIENSWTVRQAEEYVVSFKKQLKGAKTLASSPIEKHLSDHLKTKVSIKRTARGGSILVHFKSEKELQSLTKRLSEK